MKFKFKFLLLAAVASVGLYAFLSEYKVMTQSKHEIAASRSQIKDGLVPRVPANSKNKVLDLGADKNNERHLMELLIDELARQGFPSKNPSFLLKKMEDSMILPSERRVYQSYWRGVPFEPGQISLDFSDDERSAKLTLPDVFIPQQFEGLGAFPDNSNLINGLESALNESQAYYNKVRDYFELDLVLAPVAKTVVEKTAYEISENGAKQRIEEFLIFKYENGEWVLDSRSPARRH